MTRNVISTRSTGIPDLLADARDPRAFDEREMLSASITLLEPCMPWPDGSHVGCPAFEERECGELVACGCHCHLAQWRPAASPVPDSVGVVEELPSERRKPSEPVDWARAPAESYFRRVWLMAPGDVRAARESRGPPTFE